MEFIDKLEILKEANNKIFNSHTNSTIVFIYTPPKVGSTTLVTSLRISAAYKLTVIHIHDEVMLEVLTGVHNVTILDIIKYNAYIGKKVYVIDVYRSPIERKISEYFEFLAHYHFNNTEENLQNYNISRIINRFNSLFPFLSYGDYYTDKYDLDLPEKFDFEKKYLIIEKDNVTYIKLRLKDSNEWNKILQEIFAIDVVIIIDYKTENKPISELYKNFKNEYMLPSNLLEIINNCKYLNYYYSIQEKEEYLNLWSQKLSVDFVPYTEEEYTFYKKLCSENKFNNKVQREHYIYNGCICGPCQIKRRNIFLKAKNGETNFEKIIHSDAVIEHVNKINLNIVNKVNTVNKLIHKINNKNKNKNKNKCALKNNLLLNIMNKAPNKKK
jgi:hypothetical protein